MNSDGSDDSGSFTLTVLGPGAAWSSEPTRPSSSYLVSSGRDAIVLDLGQGSFAALAACRPPESVAAVLVSHLHPDHHVDLVALRHYLSFAHRIPIDREVALRAPSGLRERYDAFLGEPGFLGKLPGEPIAPGTFEEGAFTVQAEGVTHIAEAFAFRVAPTAAADAAALVYSGDCGEWTDLLPLIRPGDTVLCEAFWAAGEPEAPRMHLTARDAGAAARDGGARRLILTHLGDDADRDAARRAAQDVFDGDVLIAEQGLRVTIG